MGRKVYDHRSKEERKLERDNSCHKSGIAPDVYLKMASSAIPTKKEYDEVINDLNRKRKI